MALLRAKTYATLRVFDKESGDKYDFPISAYVISWGVNEVPTATIQISLGADVRDLRRLSPVNYTVMPFLRESNPAQILAKFEGQYSDKEDWPEGTTVIYEGKIAGLAPSIGRGKASLNVTLKHWLSNLINYPLVPTYANAEDHTMLTAQAITYGALADPHNVAGNIQTRIPPSTLGYLSDSMGLVDIELEQDLWANGLKELIATYIETPNLDMALESMLTDMKVLDDCGGLLNEVPSSMKDAWRRIEGPSKVLGTPYSKWAVPLTLTTEEDPVDVTVLQSIADSISRISLGDIVNKDGWTMLQHFCATYGAMLVPRAKTAIIAPLNPALREAYCHQMVGDDILQIDAYENVSTPIKGVVSGSVYTGAWNAEQVVKVNGAPGSLRPLCFVPEEVKNNGQWLFVRPPPWLAGVDMAMNRETLYNVRQPVAGITGTIGADEETDKRAKVETVTQNATGLLRDYLEYVYFRERLKGRAAKIASKLRFDIAPGTMLRVKAHLNQVRGLGFSSPEIQGFVNRVTINVDVRKKSALTLFQLGYVRTVEENESSLFTTPLHPLYRTSYYGAPLVDKYDIPECETE